MKKTELELQYWQSNQDPKIYKLLDASQKEEPRDHQLRERGGPFGRSLGKR